MCFASICITTAMKHQGSFSYIDCPLCWTRHQFNNQQADLPIMRLMDEIISIIVMNGETAFSQVFPWHCPLIILCRRGLCNSCRYFSHIDIDKSAFVPKIQLLQKHLECSWEIRNHHPHGSAFGTTDRANFRRKPMTMRYNKRRSQDWRLTQWNNPISTKDKKS